jgi:hypothetical protein
MGKFRDWISDGHRLLAAAIVFATLLGAWMFRYEQAFRDHQMHRNRITGVICPISEECWFRSYP